MQYDRSTKYRLYSTYVYVHIYMYVYIYIYICYHTTTKEGTRQVSSLEPKDRGFV